MYGIFIIICPKNHPNVGKYTIHGAYGYENTPLLFDLAEGPNHIIFALDQPRASNTHQGTVSPGSQPQDPERPLASPQCPCCGRAIFGVEVSCLSWRYPNSWMVYFMQNPIKIRWFVGSRILGNLHTMFMPFTDKAHLGSVNRRIMVCPVASNMSGLAGCPSRLLCRRLVQRHTLGEALE